MPGLCTQPTKKTGRKIILAAFIEPLDVLTTQGVSEIMKNEAREEVEKILHSAATKVKESTGNIPVLYTREGDLITELKKLIEEEENINVLVLAASYKNKDNPNSIINALITKEINTLRIPTYLRWDHYAGIIDQNINRPKSVYYVFYRFIDTLRV